MNASRWAAFAALLGGVAWVVSAVLGWGDEPEDVSYLVGVALFVVWLALGGYSLVSTAPLWLRAVVTIATPALGYVVWATVLASASREYIPVVVGGVLMVVAGGIGLGRAARRGPAEPEPPVRGRRAAR